MFSDVLRERNAFSYMAASSITIINSVVESYTYPVVCKEPLYIYFSLSSSSFSLLPLDSLKYANTIQVETRDFKLEEITGKFFFTVFEGNRNFRVFRYGPMCNRLNR